MNILQISGEKGFIISNVSLDDAKVLRTQQPFVLIHDSVAYLNCRFADTSAVFLVLNEAFAFRVTYETTKCVN